MKGIHLRYLGEELRVVEGVGVFQQGTVAFAPRDIAIQLLSSGEFETVTNGPTAQFFIVRIGQETITPPATGERRAEEPADFEKELEEEERRLMAEIPDKP